MNKKEVELKVQIIKTQANCMKKTLLNLGAIKKGFLRESDIYFTSLFVDFIKTRECLRIREKNNKFLELTYKGKTTELMKRQKQFWKTEINIPIKRSLKKDLITFFKLLGFKIVAEVIKDRERFALNNQEIAIDKIRGVGWFLEIENTANNKKEEKEALKENLYLLTKLKLNKANLVDEPYRDLVIKSQDKKNLHISKIAV